MRKCSSKILSIFLIGMILVTSLAMNTQVYADETNNLPILENGGFEEEIDRNDIQIYKGERVDASNGKVRSGDYSIKIGAKAPEDKEKYPLWFFNGGKGSVGLTVRNVKPYSSYTVTGYVYNETGVRMRFGMMDLEGSRSDGSQSGMIASSHQYSNLQPDWQKFNIEVTTGPRATELYIYALTEWTNRTDGAGVFYVDDVSIVLNEEFEVDEYPDFIEYSREDFRTDFPITIPQIHSFEKNEDGKQFNIDQECQLIYADDFSNEKATYFGNKLVEMGITKNFTIAPLTEGSNPKQGIVVSENTLDYDIPSEHDDKRHEAYQINIEGQKIKVGAEGKVGIQNALATLLQALRQQSFLPSGKVEDFPTQRIRGLQVDTGRRYYSIDWLKNQIEQMAYQKLNKLQLRLKDNEGIRYESKVAPQFVDTAGGFWTQEEVKDLVHFAQEFGIEVIPEIDFPGHSEQDGVYFDKSWLLMPEGYDSRTLDITLPEVREYMASVYKEAFDLFESSIVHMGGDEYFQTRNFYDEEGKLEKWAQEVSGNPEATDKDAFKLFFNELAEPFLEEGKTVLVWNDNIDDLSGPAVELDKRITIDFWAGGFYGSITAEDAVGLGYQIMSSPHPLYQDLWPERNKVDNPLPTRLYNDWSQYTYATGISRWRKIEPTDLSIGQMYPIWDDAHGYVSEYILTRGLFPRLGHFTNLMWGSDLDENGNKKLSFKETERMMYQIGTIKEEGFEQVNFEYTPTDVEEIKNKLQMLVELNILYDDITGAPRQRAMNLIEKIFEIDDVEVGQRTNTIFELIHDFENIFYEAPKYGNLKVNYVDEDGNNIGDSLKSLYTRDDFKCLRYEIETPEIEGYTFKEDKRGSAPRIGALEENNLELTLIYSKTIEKVEPSKPDKPSEPSKPSEGSTNSPQSQKSGQKQSNTVEASDSSNITSEKLPSTGLKVTSVLGVSTLLVALGGGIYLANNKKRKEEN